MSEKQLYKFFVTVLLVLQVYFFDVIPHFNQLLTHWNTDVSKKFELIILIFILLIRLVPKTNIGVPNSKTHFNIFSLMIIVGTLAVAMGSAPVYKQSVWNGLSSFYGFLIIPIGYWALAPFLEKYENLLWFYQRCLTFCFIYILIQYLQAFIYKYTGVILLQYTVSGSVNLLTFGRYTEAIDFITFVSVFISVKPFLLRKRWNKKEIILVIMIVFYHIFISKGRMYLLITLSTFLLAILLQFKKILSSAIFFLASFNFLFFLPKIVDKFFLAFTSGERTSSYTIRTYGITYYYNHIFLNKWFGIGFPNTTYYNWLLHGTAGFDVGAGLLNYVDLGLLGTVAILGVVGLIFICFLFFLMIMSIVRGKNKKAALVLNLGLIGSFATLSPFDMQRAWLFSLILILLDFSWNNTKDGLSNEK